MDRLRCPICLQEGLMETAVKTVSHNRIVCENERYIHARIGMVDILIKTEAAKKDEEDEAQLVPH